MNLPIESKATRATFSFVKAAATAGAIAIAVGSCGGAVAPLPGDGNNGNGNAPTNDSGVAPPTTDAGGVHLLSNDPTCPRNIPTLPALPTSPGGAAIGGTSCTGSTACEYGSTSANPACNTILQCVSRRGSCDGIEDCERSNADRVWSTDFAPYGSNPVRCQAVLQLQVPPSASGCPKVRPAIGESCNENDIDCVYSSCSWADACSEGCFWAVATCMEGVWRAGVAHAPCEQLPGK